MGLLTARSRARLGRACLVYVAWVWVMIGRMDADGTASHAVREDPARGVAELLIHTLFTPEPSALFGAYGAIRHGDPYMCADMLAEAFA